MFDYQQIVNGALGSILGCVVLALLMLLFRSLVRAAPRLWTMLQRRLGRVGAIYQRLIDSLVVDRDARLRVYLDLLACLILFCTSLVILALGAVVSLIADLSEAPLEGRIVSTTMCMAAVVLAIFAIGCAYLDSSALEIAKKKQNDQAANGNKAATPIIATEPPSSTQTEMRE